uniref:Inward rectifier potassium channel 1 n=1 Tax=Nilaparvata lugens TaxID=108931 RepID=A0A384UHY2_NILLU|nr:inward rectifier potassium channel 1 [Nilaparvata lugens]
MEAATRWEQLISSTLTPTTAVAVKLAVTPDQDENDVTGPADHQHKTQNGGLLGSLRHLPGISRFTSSTNNEQRSPLFRYRQTRFSSRRVRRRVVFKHGDCNVVQGNVAKRRRKYLQDIFTTLVDAQWRWTLLVFAMNFFLSWLGFAIIWWLIVFWHGDLEPTAQANSSWVPCVRDVNTFTSCFLFSVETQHTIGYGAKHTTDECLEAIFVMCLQSITGVMIQAFMVGIVFAKLSRPKKRTQTLLFSRNAVICQRDGQLCLMFRVGDMRKSHIIEAHVRAQLIKKKVTREGEVLPFYQQELKVGGDGEEDKIFFIWPTTIVHKITPSSPLYSLSASDMLRERFEIVVILEGVIESTGMTTQARSSYLPNEILWGHRFEPLVSFKKETGEHEVDYNLFNNTYEVDTPLCSAQSLDRVIGLHQHNSDLQKYGISTTTNTSLV